VKIPYDIERKKMKSVDFRSKIDPKPSLNEKTGTQKPERKN